MVWIINSNHGTKEPTCGYQDCSTSQILIFGGYVKVRKYLYTEVIKWVNTILNLIDTRVILRKYEDTCMVYRPNAINNINTMKFPYPTGIK